MGARFFGMGKAAIVREAHATRSTDTMPTDTLPLISCIMPTYGRPAYVDEAVAMFLAQDYPNKELVILNDCAGQVFSADFPCVRIINQQARWSSLGAKRNGCITAAHGSIIAIWDDDDVYLPWRISWSWSEMQRYATSFYRPREFWAYWGSDELHDNQAVESWVSHAWVMFTKDLWEQVGGYPDAHCGEDALFFERIHRKLGQTFIAYDVSRADRFAILRGTSQYEHMSIPGGARPLDTAPVDHRVMPSPIRDPILRRAYDRLVAARPHVTAMPCEAAYPVDPTLWEAVKARSDREPELSVCVALKNRSRVRHESRELRLFPRCVSSLAAAQVPDLPIELVIADFMSDDWPLADWIAECAPSLPVRVVTIDESFSRGRGLTVAASHARSERLLLSDADLVISPSALRRAIEVIDGGRAWFPILRCMHDDDTPAGWIDDGYGLAGIDRAMFDATGGVPEFRSWGGEDDIFLARVQARMPVVRERCEEVWHQWHPERCRHDSYERAMRADYYDHLQARSLQAGMPAEVIFKVYRGMHPHWEGPAQLLVLLCNGRMERAGVDAGEYEYQEDSYLALKWDRWPVEILMWNRRRRIFHDPTRQFSLIPVVV
jgi:glycosyltransferase involved in cell wall biosynthesis